MMMADVSNNSLLGTARKMWASGGFFGLWRGNLVSVVKVIPQSAIQYAVGAPGNSLLFTTHATATFACAIGCCVLQLRQLKPLLMIAMSKR